MVLLNLPSIETSKTESKTAIVDFQNILWKIENLGEDLWLEALVFSAFH